MSIRKREKVVLVEWLDTAIAGGWERRTDTEEMRPHACTRVGILVHRDEHQIILIGILSASKSYDETNVQQIIPAGCVIKYRVLAELKPSRR